MSQPIMSPRQQASGFGRGILCGGHRPLSPGDRLDLEVVMEQLRRSKPPCVGYLTLHFIEGLDYRGIAEIYKSTANAVRMHIARSLTLARELVAKQG